MSSLYLRLFSVFYLALILAPVLFLFFDAGEPAQIDATLVREAISNTGFVSCAVVVLCTLLGLIFAYWQVFYQVPGQGFLHALTLMPLAFPAYVLAFVYIGNLGASSDWGLYQWIEVQGEAWFLVFILTLALLPYIYFFSCLGFQWVRQSEWETEKLMQSGSLPFFRYVIWPHIGFFVLSGQVLVLFEALSDFGASSVVNTPMMTTLIYKAWFDLFSFAGAVRLALWYSLLIFVLLLIELYLKSYKESARGANLDPIRRQKLCGFKAVAVLSLRWLYTILAFIFPLVQVIFWSLQIRNFASFQATLWAGLHTLALSVCVAFTVIIFSLLLAFLFKKFKKLSNFGMIFSSVGYGIPGTILAVSFYGILMTLFSEVSVPLLITTLILGLSYKFLSIGLRPIGETVTQLPQSLDEMSLLFEVGWWQKVRIYWGPYLRESVIIGFLLTCLEVMKEMPLTLMLAPSEYATLSIQIYNLTSEGEWEKAAVPSFILVCVGMVSVIFLKSTQRERAHES